MNLIFKESYSSGEEDGLTVAMVQLHYFPPIDAVIFRLPTPIKYR